MKDKKAEVLQSVLEKTRATIKTFQAVNLEDLIEIVSLSVKMQDKSNLLSAKDIEYIVDLVHSEIPITYIINEPIIAEGFEPWLEPLLDSGDLKWSRWERFSNLLTGEGKGAIVDDIDAQLNRLLDLAGNPATPGDWDRKGLVIGSVQSGKTSNYLGLLNKAADAGYRLFVIIGGHTEELRLQTQRRVDTHFIGNDSTYLQGGVVKSKQEKKIGIGSLPGHQPVNSFTTVNEDFSNKHLKSLNMSLDPGSSVPNVFVVKKNASVLKSLTQFLKSTASGEDGKLEFPIMVIDDESDYASINIKANDPDQQPSSINRSIRNLLAVSRQSSYIGFTATPFANIFIDHEAFKDLFPRDFILPLNTPNDYLGVQELFGKEDPDPRIITEIDDAVGYAPFGHGITHRLDGLPESLKDAIRLYFAANAIRDIREPVRQPTSMLVNVTSYNDVQVSVHSQVQEFAKVLQNLIEVELGMEGWSDQAKYSTELLALREVFERHYNSGNQIPESWGEISKHLMSANQGVATELVNGKTTDERNVRKKEGDLSDREILIGGLVLSRGLTLEGLVISYFYRYTRTADTLLQMGRWFGYRPRYEDLVRVWIDSEVASFFTKIAESVKSLYKELQQMASMGLTPAEYGLRIRYHPETLLITARNKMRSAGSIEELEPRGETKETHKLPNSEQVLKDNYEEVLNFLNVAAKEGKVFNTNSKSYWVVRGVPRVAIADLFKKFQVRVGDDPLLYFDNISDWIKDTTSENLQHWDVVLAIGGQGKLKKNLNINGELIEVKTSSRTLKNNQIRGTIEFQNRRVATGGNLKSQIELLYGFDIADEEESNEKYLIRKHLKAPLLSVFLVGPNDASTGLEAYDENLVYAAIKYSIPSPLPEEEGSFFVSKADKPKFLVNTVYQKAFANSEGEDAED